MTTCLIIDDNDINRIVAGKMVEKLGVEVAQAESAEAALPLIASIKPEAILLDWHMPGMSGIELLKQLRNTELGRATAIFIYSGVEDKEGIQAALEAGADGFIPKPITPEKITKEFKKIRLI